MSQYLILPDIHGRGFWKEAVRQHGNECDKIIFLGDYVDPYPQEGITRRDAIDNFEEILDFAKANEKKVVLLLGNHDLHYVDHYFKVMAGGGRMDKTHAYHIADLFKAHWYYFHLAHEEKINDKTYLFTHAGIIKGWYNEYKDIIGDLRAINLNALTSTKSGIQSLCSISVYRWGGDNYGSPLWADIHEHMNKDNVFDDIYQVFGHTQLVDEPIITDTFADLDCRRAFILYDNGKFNAI